MGGRNDLFVKLHGVMMVVSVHLVADLFLDIFIGKLIVLVSTD